MPIINAYYAMQREYLASVVACYGAAVDGQRTAEQAIDGSLKLLDAIFLAERIQAAQPRHILEVGSFLGFSTRWILECSAHFGSRLTSVDPNITHRVFSTPRTHMRGFCEKFAERTTCIDAFFGSKDDLEVAAPNTTVPIGVVSEPFGTFDFAFVDGNHTETATTNNILLAAACMPEGGVVVVHDVVSWPGVFPAIASVVAAHDTIDLLSIDGLEFHNATNASWKIPPQQSEWLRGSLSDGLGILAVRPLKSSASVPVETRQVEPCLA